MGRRRFRWMADTPRESIAIRSGVALIATPIAFIGGSLLCFGEVPGQAILFTAWFCILPLIGLVYARTSRSPWLDHPPQRPVDPIGTSLPSLRRSPPPQDAGTRPSP